MVPGDEFDVIRVDDLNVQYCDLLLLDVEGYEYCLLYTSDAADERSSVDLGGRRIIKKQTPDVCNR